MPKPTEFQRQTGDIVPRDAGEAPGGTGRPTLCMTLTVVQAETVPVTALVTLPAWRALAARLRREQDATDRAIADAIDAATEAL